MQHLTRRSVLSLAMALAACATPEPADPLAGTQWLRSDDDNASPHNPTIAFTARGASGFAGCNRWFSAVTRDATAMRFGNVGMTRMACQAESQTATERNFSDALALTRAWRFEDGDLVLLNEAGDPVARFVRN